MAAVITMAGQLYQLVIMAAFGLGAAFVYDWLRAARRILPHSDMLVAAEDVIFWLLCAVLVPVLIFRLNYGELRLFLFLGIVIGVVLYFVLISRIFLKIALFVFGAVKAVIRILAMPFVYIHFLLTKIFEYFVNFLKKLLQKPLKCGRIYLAFLYKKTRACLNVIIKKH